MSLTNQIWFIAVIFLNFVDSMRRIQAAILLLLFSSTLFANNVELHYCHGALTDVALLGTTSCTCPEHEEAHEPDVEAETSCCPHEKKKRREKAFKGYYQ